MSGPQRSAASSWKCFNQQHWFVSYSASRPRSHLSTKQCRKWVMLILIWLQVFTKLPVVICCHLLSCDCTLDWFFFCLHQLIHLLRSLLSTTIITNNSSQAGTVLEMFCPIQQSLKEETHNICFVTVSVRIIDLHYDLLTAFFQSCFQNQFYQGLLQQGSKRGGAT